MMGNTPREILKHYWGYDSFRPLQEEIVASVLEGHDTLGMLPTGGGKSITFQVPGLVLGGLTLVVTPLIALMKDQTDRLQRLGIKAAAVYMDMSPDEIRDTYDRVETEHYNFLYLSPERLQTRLLRARLPFMDVRLLVVDEAHCISQWGYDFRPPYLCIAETRRYLAEVVKRPSPVPCIALTATAPPEVVSDICRRLEFRKGYNIFQASFVRPNLTYTVLHSGNPFTDITRLLADGRSAIIYVRSRLRTRDYAEALVAAGIKATFYHAGLTAQQKEERQEAWMKGEIPVVCATNAFGMGIDKPDVRTVIHIDIPPSPEEYYQEAGRAGRDGLPATAYLFVSDTTVFSLQARLIHSYPERDYIRMVYDHLAYFFQLEIGEGQDRTYEFDIFRFCAAYKLQAGDVHSALHLLTLAGYIQYVEEPEAHSRVMFTCSRESLYHLDRFDRDCQRIITGVLRLYTGVFADFQPFSEDRIAAFAHLDRETVYQKLLLLSRYHVLHYIPARQKPCIRYTMRRLDTDEVVIRHHIYEDRRERDQKRVDAMLDYATSSDECRLVRLVRYFGENVARPCGKCDVCLSLAQSPSAAAETQQEP